MLGVAVRIVERKVRRMYNEESKLNVTIAPAKLIDLLTKRAAGHQRRVAELEQRITALQALANDKDRKVDVPESKQPGWWTRLWHRDYAMVVSFPLDPEGSDLLNACADARTTADETKIVLARLAHAPVSKIGVAIQEARSQRHQHVASVTWLQFTAENLTPEPVRLPASEAFLAYLLDVDHPTAMPNYSMERCGVQ